MTSRTTDIHCVDCNEYLYSVLDLKEKDRERCYPCLREKEEPLEYFLRTSEDGSRSLE
tara:strand:- start:1320 stop:1493 length:174 start_codon:yes stop_codon:yes gene_type:complete